PTNTSRKVTVAVSRGCRLSNHGYLMAGLPLFPQSLLWQALKLRKSFKICPNLSEIFRFGKNGSGIVRCQFNFTGTTTSLTHAIVHKILGITYRAFKEDFGEVQGCCLLRNPVRVGEDSRKVHQYLLSFNPRTNRVDEMGFHLLKDAAPHMGRQCNSNRQGEPGR